MPAERASIGSETELLEENFVPRFNRNKRRSVFAPPVRIEELTEPRTHEKTAGVAALLASRLQSFFLFAKLQPAELEHVVATLKPRKTIPGEVVVEQGAAGDYFYVVESGLYDVFVDGVHVAEYNECGTFGELALLHNTERAATVLSSKHGTVWYLDRQIFCCTVLKGALNQRIKIEQSLSEFPMLAELSEEERRKLTDALEPCTFEDGVCIIKQGDNPDYFYLLLTGKCRVTRQALPSIDIREVGTLDPGAHFGELALLTDGPRQASVWSVGRTMCARLKVKAFERLLGKCDEIMRRHAGDYERQIREVFGPPESGNYLSGL